MNFRAMFVRTIGAIFIIVGLISMVYASYIGEYEQIIWLCYISILILGIGMLMSSGYLIVSQINILLIPTVIWNIDFFYVLSFGQSLWGVSDYFFSEGRELIANLISLQHLFIIPLSICTLFVIRIGKKGAWIFSIVQMFVIFIISRLFTSSEANMNCVFENCLGFGIRGVPYWLAWFIVVIVGVFWVDYFVNRVKWFREKKN